MQLTLSVYVPLSTGSTLAFDSAIMFITLNNGYKGNMKLYLCASLSLEPGPRETSLHPG